MKTETELSHDIGGEPGAFSAEGFRRRAAGHLTFDEAELNLRSPLGDHVLNPTLKRAVGAPAPRDAAVLMPVVRRAGEAGVILTIRTEHLSSHAGQVAFPGGKMDAADPDPVATALREAEEEIGLDRRFVEPIGCFTPYVTNSGFRIVPVIGLVEPGFTLEPNAGEVAEVFEVPLGFLMSAANHRLQSRVWQGITRYFYEMPWQGRYIWGVTAGIIRQVYEHVYGEAG